MNIPKHIKTFIEGNNPLMGVVKIEAESGQPLCDVFMNNGTSIKKSYTKFVFMRDLDKMGAYSDKELVRSKLAFSKVEAEYSKLPEMEKEYEALKASARKAKKDGGDLDAIKASRELLKKEIDILKLDYEKASARLASARKSKTVSYSVPSMSDFKKSIDAFNRKSRLYGDKKIAIKELRMEHDHYRLDFGYTYLVYTEAGTLNNLYKCLESAGLPYRGKGGDTAEALKLYYSVKPYEMAYISNGIRPFKGIKDYSDVSKVCIDLETTSLHASTGYCDSCSKAYPMSNPHDLPSKCSSCGGDSFSIKESGQIFMAGMKSTDGEEKTLIARKGDDGRVIASEEKALIEGIFAFISEKRPSVVMGYNSEAFDFGYIFNRVERLGINVKPNKCLKCYNGFMRPTETGYICSEESCQHELSHEAIAKYSASPEAYSKDLLHWCPSCKKGNIVKGRTMYGCMNYEECDQRYGFDEYAKSVSAYMESLNTWIPSTLSERHGAYKDKFPQTLKLGGEQEVFRPTKIYGLNVIDVMHAVRKARAVNSSMPNSFSLKIMAAYKPLKPRKDRVLIPHAKIWDFYTDRLFLVSPDMVYKPIPEGTDPHAYLNIANNSPESLSDYSDSFYGPNKGYEVEEGNEDALHEYEFGVVEEDSRPYFAPPEDAGEEELYAYIKGSDFFDTNKGHFRLMSGKELLEKYVMDDVYDAMAVDGVYSKERFLTNKYFPTNFDRFYTMGVASAWNLMIVAYCFENGIAMPYQENEKLPVGGLSRMWMRGVEDRIKKADYASLYPSLMLAMDMIPLFAKYLKDILQYFYDMRMYYNTRKKLGDIYDAELKLDLFKKYVKEDGNEELIRMVDKLLLNSDTISFESVLAKYVQDADNIQLPCKININAIFGFLGSFVGLAANMMNACNVTSAGRMFLRSAILFMQKFGLKPLICDTDGINFSCPEYITLDIETFKPIDTPIPFDELEYKGEKGIDALIKRFNELSLPSEGPMKLDSDGKYDRSFNAAKKNYINIDDGKVKFTGNSFKSSTAIGAVRKFFDEEVKYAISSGDMKYFLDKYYYYAESILDGNMPAWIMAKKAKIKQTVEDYLNRGTDKNGRPKAKQAHMELLASTGIKMNVGETVYFINNGNKKSDADADTIDIYEYKPKQAKVCSSCKAEWNDSHESCDNEVYLKKGKNPVKAICGSKDYIVLNEYKCINPSCKKTKMLSDTDVRLISDDLYESNMCGKTTNGVKCSCNEYTLSMSKEKVGERMASYILDESVLKDDPMKVMPYNRELYLEVFNNKVRPLQYMLPPEHRDFFMGMDGKRKPIPENIGFHSEGFDSLEESITLEKKEIDFWNASGLNPLECVPVWWVAKQIRITDFIPKWDLFNKVWLDISEKRPNMVIKPSKRMSKVGEHYMEWASDSVFLLKRMSSEGDCTIAIYKDKTWHKAD